MPNLPGQPRLRPSTTLTRAAAWTAGAFVGLAATPAAADPQISGGVTGGYGLHRLNDGAESVGHLGLRADALFLRKRNTDGALGPYVEGLTVAFSDLQFGGGLSAQVPGLSTLAVVGSAGPFARTSALGLRAGLSGSLFFGLRPFNFHGSYGMANGLFVQGRLGVGETRQAEVLFGAQIDLQIFALPFLLVWGSLR